LSLTTLICPEVMVGGMVKEVHAAHILVKNKDSCDKILVEFKAGKSWDELAKKNSTCPSAKKGGDLGWFKRGMMVKEFEDAAFNHAKGEVVGPVKTQFGWHLIQVTDQK
jgi:peptidyl-prolyl cis-trans isomerase C